MRKREPSISGNSPDPNRAVPPRILDQKTLPKKADTYPALKGDFAGLRKFRVGNYRVIFAILDNAVVVLKIGDRKDVYK